jgi:hypothetical protein
VTVEISIGELRSTVHAVGTPLLHPAVLERIVEIVLARLREEQEREHRAQASRRLLDDAGGFR